MYCVRIMFMLDVRLLYDHTACLLVQVELHPFLTLTNKL